MADRTYFHKRVVPATSAAATARKRDAGAEGKVVVELAGELSDDCDLDADHGALLIFPERVVSVERLDPAVVDSIRDRVGEVG